MLYYTLINIIVVVLLSRPRFSDCSVCCTDEENCSLTIKDRNVEIRVVTANVDAASLDCPDLENDKNINITLCKQQTMLHSTVFISNQQNPRFPQNQRFHVSVKNNTVHYLIDNPQAEDTGLYSCISHTSPTNPTDKTRNTYLFVKDPVQHEGSTGLVLSVGCGLLAFYSLIVTVVTGSFAWKLKCVETPDQVRDYTTKPGEFRKVRARKNEFSKHTHLPTAHASA